MSINTFSNWPEQRAAILVIGQWSRHSIDFQRSAHNVSVIKVQETRENTDALVRFWKLLWSYDTSGAKYSGVLTLLLLDKLRLQVWSTFLHLHIIYPFSSLPKKLLLYITM